MLPESRKQNQHAFSKAEFYRAAVIPYMVKDRENMPVDIVVMMKERPKSKYKSSLELNRGRLFLYLRLTMSQLYFQARLLSTYYIR